MSSSTNRVRPRLALHLPLLLHHLVALGCQEFPYHKLAKESQLLWKTDLPVKIILAANFLAQLLLHHPHLLMTETATHAKIHQIIPFNSTKTTWKVDEIRWRTKTSMVRIVYDGRPLLKQLWDASECHDFQAYFVHIGHHWTRPWNLNGPLCKTTCLQTGSMTIP